VVPLVTRIASALGHWLGESFGGNLRLAPDLDEVPALSIEREALWKRVGEASFLTDDEKRAATGYEPRPASFAPSSLATLLAKYDPNQPRVPGGNPDGGQWTSGGGNAGSALNDSRVLSDANPEDEWDPNAQYANLRRGNLVYRLPNGKFVIVPPAQAARLQAAQNQADTLTREVRERDPNWRPETIVTSMTVEGEITRYESRAEQARNRLEEIRLGIGGNYGPPINPTGFRVEPWQPLRSTDGPRLIEAYIASNPNKDLLGDSAWSIEENTVAVTTFNGSLIFGVNSTAPTALHQDRVLANQMRDVLLEKYPSELSTGNIGRFPNNALYHAEAAILLRAARANGGTLAGQYLEIHVNRLVCPHCERVLPILTREIGFPTVKIIEPSGNVRILRNGVWE
jgi:hypothetical protein